LEPFLEAAGIFESVDGGFTFVIYAIPQYSDNGYARSDDGARTCEKAVTPLPWRKVAEPRDEERLQHRVVDEPMRRRSPPAPFVRARDRGLIPC